MYKVSRQEFKKIVKEGIGAIPKRFLEKLDNVVIVAEDAPTAAQKKQMKIRSGWALFGLYEGVPQAVRGDHYTNVLPDKITIFQQTIEEAAESLGEMKEIVKNTVWHEIAHHFGLEEKEVRRAEKKRKKK